MSARARALVLVAGVALAGCGREGPPAHPVGEITARASAKLDLIELVVCDAERAERVRRVYEQLAALGHEFDRARARSILQARSVVESRATAAAQASPASAADLELLLVPPIEQSKALFDRYETLMLEARTLLTEDEFEKLNRVR